MDFCRSRLLSKMTNPPPIAPKPRLSSRHLNGDCYTTHKRSPLRRTSVNGKEREALTASIKSSHEGRQLIDLDSTDGPQTNGHGSFLVAQVNAEAASAIDFDIPPRDPRDEAPENSPLPSTRPASPYTLNPPIDFDGLSWPSEQRLATSSRYD